MVVSNEEIVVVVSVDVDSVVDWVDDCVDDGVLVVSAASVVEFRIGSGEIMSKQSWKSIV